MKPVCASVATTTKKAECSRWKMAVTHVIMKTMCPSSYHYNGSMAPHTVAHMMYVHWASSLYIRYQNIIQNLQFCNLKFHALDDDIEIDG